MASSCRDFDPRTRAFSDEELKPQPIIKKSRKQFVPDDLKDDKYWARRRKNNLAAKRSRDARRMKENQIALRAGFLEKEVTNVCIPGYCMMGLYYLPIQKYRSIPNIEVKAIVGCFKLIGIYLSVFFALW